MALANDIVEALGLSELTNAEVPPNHWLDLPERDALQAALSASLTALAMNSQDRHELAAAYGFHHSGELFTDCSVANCVRAAVVIRTGRRLV